MSIFYKLVYVNELGGRIDFSFDGGDGYVVSTKTGFTENNISVSMSQGVSQIGGTVQGQSVQPKPIVITGELIRNAAEKREHMLKVIVPQVPAQLIYNDMWFLNVVPTQTPVIGANPHSTLFQFSLIAAFPYWQSTAQNLTQVAGLQPLFRFPWNPSDPSPFYFSKRTTSLFANARNEGSVSVPFNIEFKARATVVNPKLIKVDTREYIRIVKTMSYGEIITITHTNDDITVMSDISGLVVDNMKYLDINSTFYLLNPGDNILRYDADSNFENLDVRVYSRDTVAGVW